MAEYFETRISEKLSKIALVGYAICAVALVWLFGFLTYQSL